MSNEKSSWSGIISLMSPETRLFALIALLAEGALVGLVAVLPSGQRLLAFASVIVLFVLIVGAALVVRTRSRSHDHNWVLMRKVTMLRETLFEHRFVPDLIVAIPRGGLAVAGLLAQRLGEEHVVPVIALQRRGEPGAFDNPFNPVQLTRADFDGDPACPVNVLVVDDICRSGRTLSAARRYLQAALGTDFVIETAAVSVYASSHAERPTYVVDPVTEPIRDAAGQLEERLD